MPFHPSNSSATLPFYALFCPFPFIILTLSTSVLLYQIFLWYPLYILPCALISPYYNHPFSAFCAPSPTSLSLSLLEFCFLPFVFFLFHSIMEPQQQLQQQQQQNQQQPNEDSGSSKGSFLCRQSSTRWTPTTDQIRILKDLYYNNGVRSPSAEQIQRISARLRQYGKIEGKNVFYWFQNHKARERQKKRFTTDMPMQRSLGNSGWRPDDPIHNKFHTIPTPGEPSLSKNPPFYSLIFSILSLLLFFNFLSSC